MICNPQRFLLAGDLKCIELARVEAVDLRLGHVVGSCAHQESGGPSISLRMRINQLTRIPGLGCPIVDDKKLVLGLIERNERRLRD